MKRLALAALLAMLSTAHAEVPSTVSFTARLVDDQTGAALTGSHNVRFRLFDLETGGAALWTETVDTEVEDGLVFHDLGSVEPLGPVFDGKKLFLEVTLDDVVMDPRVGIGSVPYAVRANEAANAAAIGGLTLDQLQKRVTGGCTSGNFIIGVNDDGTVACAPDLSGSGDITDVAAGNGLTGGGSAGNVTLSLVNCGQGEVLKFQGSVWACAADANAGGDITAVTVGGVGGLSGGGANGDVALSLLSTCANGQILRFNGTWGCSNDLDTNSGGTVTSVTASGNSGLVVGGTPANVTLSLLTSCSNNQVLKFNAGTGAWGCANDVDTDTNAGGDVTDVLGGAGLTVTNSAGPQVTLDIGQGTGILVGANAVSLDTTFTDARYDARYDPRYVNVTGDSMGGNLDMGGFRLTNRSCPTAYTLFGTGLCVENIDEGNLTFSQCANKCRQEVGGAHMCSSSELRAAIASGITIPNGGANSDWVDDLDSTTNALFIVDQAAAQPMGSQAATLTAFCRCCTDLE
jgi:hypothetical protein